MKTRRAIIAFAAGIVALVVLHPPWTVHAVVYRMSVEGSARVPPRAVVDTVTWRVPVAPLYLRHSLELSAGDLAAYEARLNRGDTTALQEWRQKIQRIEQLYRVPDSLRADWDTDALGRARVLGYQKKIVSTTFEIDVVRLIVYLIFIAVPIAAALRFGYSKRRTSPYQR